MNEEFIIDNVTFKFAKIDTVELLSMYELYFFAIKTGDFDKFKQFFDKVLFNTLYKINEYDKFQRIKQLGTKSYGLDLISEDPKAARTITDRFVNVILTPLFIK